jgi:hypothetical protein
MGVWQYAQLTITVDGRDQERTRTVLWHGPGQEVEESDSGMPVLDLLNKVGADGWELTSQEEHRPIADGHTYWDAPWSLSTYTFKRRVNDTTR